MLGLQTSHPQYPNIVEQVRRRSVCGGRLADSTGPTEPLNRLAAVATSLQRRGRELDDEAAWEGSAW